jgi:hypothetical protein
MLSAAARRRRSLRPRAERIAYGEALMMGQNHTDTIRQANRSRQPASLGKNKSEPERRLSVDLPQRLYRRFKTASSKGDGKIVIEVKKASHGPAPYQAMQRQRPGLWT